MKLDMRVDKAGDEEIIVSVAGADFVLHVEAVGAGSVDEGFGLQFIGEQRVGAAWSISIGSCGRSSERAMCCRMPARPPIPRPDR